MTVLISTQLPNMIRAVKGKIPLPEKQNIQFTPNNLEMIPNFIILEIKFIRQNKILFHETIITLTKLVTWCKKKKENYMQHHNR